MSWAYVDTSAFVKRYVDEPGRREVVALLRRHEIVISALLPVELLGAIRRRVTERAIVTARSTAILRRFAADRVLLVTVGVTPEVLAAAESLVAVYPLRALDAIHVASAQLFAARIGRVELTFVSADKRQTDVAAAMGMRTAVII